MSAESAHRARVLVLAGPSGAGKSRLARRLHAAHGWPVVQLDDFYRDVGDPDLPMSPQAGLPDWDDVRSWRLDDALTALETLCREGIVEVPVYDIATSRATGTHQVELGDHPIVIAEGIFAADTIAGLKARGILAAAWCIRNRPSKTFARRLIRDLAERRKPPLTLVRRGLTLCRLEPGIVGAQQALGAEPMTAREAEARVPRLTAHTEQEGRRRGAAP
ncbi:uridine kinase family protein [Ornithinimicrobium faecis]|uniref:ATP-binding protein n=1 Tax=Ornithinimicrobium faecis TaxID=2934158 RepID=A0ABY4YQC1_9MICO|nr:MULTISPECIES: AAA family ATPase [unclassified Ornithinimicrobium]USQ78756.1 ATP-binding protein [Ornithinimicrobium sp. HY1793]